MAKPVKIITAAAMDRMTPQERADAVDASIIRSWDDVSESFRAEIFATARCSASNDGHAPERIAISRSIAEHAPDDPNSVSNPAIELACLESLYRLPQGCT